MDNFVVHSKNDSKRYRRITNGSEGEIFAINDQTVMKKFYFPSSDVLLNKMQKIRLLNLENIEGIALPQKIVLNEFGKEIGYTMNYIKTRNNIETFRDIDVDSQYNLTSKISYLLKYEEILKKAHKRGITIVDISCPNILIDNSDNVHIVDIDNCKINQYNSDIIPVFAVHYQRRVSPIIDENTDKYVFGIFALELLVEDGMIWPHLIPYKYDPFLFEYVRALDISKEAKEVFEELFSDTRKKQYIGEILKTLVKEEEKVLKLTRRIY